jgi:hypothetical protein
MVLRQGKSPSPEALGGGWLEAWLVRWLWMLSSWQGCQQLDCLLSLASRSLETRWRNFFILGIEVAGGVQLGIETHYLIGPLIGAIFGVLVTQVKALRVDTLKKSIVFSVLYVEILAQPILATTPILLKMTAAETLQWFGFSFVMHFLMAVVLGAVVSYGPLLAVIVKDK